MLYHVKQNDYRRLLSDRDLSAIKKAEIFSLFSRINTLFMIAKAGSGHIGTSFSSIDIFSWLHLNVLTEEDLFFSSKGHDAPGLYSVLMGIEKIEYECLHKLRRLNGLPGHPDVTTTPCMVTNTGSLGMGVSKAKGLVKANRLDGKSGRVYVLTGDGELQEGHLGITYAVNDRSEEITVIIDHNKIQSDTWVENVSDLGDLELKLKSYGWHVERCNGNNFEDLSKTVEATKKVKGQPQIIIADTVKGCGVSFMEGTTLGDDEFYRFHSGAPSQGDYKKAVDELVSKTNKLLKQMKKQPIQMEEVAYQQKNIQRDPTLQKLIPAYENALTELGGEHQEIVVLDADLMIDCGLLSFRNKYPERFIECGIAEQDMVSQAGALALKGMLPISHSFACFLAPRANEQFFNNASENTKCIYTGSLAGLLPAGPGHSHQMVRDISVLGGVPNLTLLEPSCEEEVRMILDYAVNKNKDSTYIRLVSVPCEIPYTLPVDYVLKKGEGVALTRGEDAIIFTYGPVMLAQAFNAADVLIREHEFGLKVINLPWLNEIDQDWIREIIGNIKHVFTLDNHLIKGGQGERIGAAIAQASLVDISFNMFGIEEVPVCGLNHEVLSYYKLDVEGVVMRILETRT